MSSKGKTIILTAAATLAVVLLGFACAIGNDTLIDRYIPVMICLAAAAAVGAPLARPTGRWLGIRRRSISFAIASGFMFSMLFFAFHAINFYGSDHDSAVEFNSRIVAKHSEERHRSRRVGRNRYVDGEAYMEYYISVELPDGRRKKLRVPVGEYVDIRKGQEVSLKIETGFFGIPVIRETKIIPRQKSRTRHRRFNSN